MSKAKGWDFDLYARVRNRRETKNQSGFTAINFQSNDRRNVLVWIDTHTVSRYYFGSQIISFEDDKEAVMFQLGYKE